MSSSTVVVPFSQDLLYPSRFSAFCPPSRVLRPLGSHVLHTTALTCTYTLPRPLSLVTPRGLKRLPLTVFLAQYHTARSQTFTRSIESFTYALKESCLGRRRQCTRQLGPCSPRAGGHKKYYITLSHSNGNCEKPVQDTAEGAVRGPSLFQGTRQDFPGRHRCSDH